MATVLRSAGARTVPSVSLTLAIVCARLGILVVCEYQCQYLTDLRYFPACCPLGVFCISLLSIASHCFYGCFFVNFVACSISEIRKKFGPCRS